MSRFIRASGAAALAVLPAEAVAHAFGARYDLPLPLSLWLTAAGSAVALSFVVFALMLRRRTGALPRRLTLLRLHPLALEALRAASVCVFFVLIAAGLIGTQDPFRNLAPAFVWIAWWIGFTYVSAVAGDLWALLNPWNALYHWAEALARRIRPVAPLGLRRNLPKGVGVWPATVLLLAFGWIEIVWDGNAVPANIAWLAIGYSLLTWGGMLLYGREAWLRSGEVFAVYFGMIARLAPSELRVTNAAASEWNLRPPAAGLLDSSPASMSAAVFVIVMLATVTFDGLRETPLWAGLLRRVSHPGESITDLIWSASATAGLLLVPCVFVLVILGASGLMAWLTRGDARPASAEELARLFVPTLLPIAFAYHVAHYLSYLLVAGQVVIPLASDPFGHGWDLFGTAHYKIAVGIIGARFAWYTSVVVIVLGHVLAMYVAHRLALARFSGPRTARRSQYPLAALMVAYTMVSLWILAQPIVEAEQEPVKSRPVTVLESSGVRWAGESLRGAWTALSAHPGVFASVTVAVAALNVLAPVAILSVVRRPLDFYTFNPWLKRLPEYLASGDVAIGEKLRKLPDLALFWFSADATYGGTDWGFAVDVTDLGRIFLISALFGLYFALWRSYRDLALGGARAASALRRGGLAGAGATAFGISTGACSVTGCGAPVIPVLGLAFVGLESGTLHLLAQSSRVATIALFAGLVLAVGYLGYKTSRGQNRRADEAVPA